MREYKFRGKCVERDKWVYGYYVKGIQEDEAYILKNHNWLLGDDFIDVYPETVGQFTGLKDKNGKEIYEGDILEEEPGYYFEVIWSVECAKFKLQWRTKAIQYPEWNRGVNMTVIGNRWDNPELLKEVE